jgi:peptidylprolyl isomerase
LGNCGINTRGFTPGYHLAGFQPLTYAGALPNLPRAASIAANKFMMMKLRFLMTAATSLWLLGCNQPTQPSSDTPSPTNAPSTATTPAITPSGEMTTTASGLKYQVLKQGSGTVSPKATDMVKVHYHGTLLDGTVFDSSVQRGEPTSFPLNRVISGWTEGVQLMKVGDKFKFEIPANLAYGENSPSPVIPPNSTLVFEVELLGIE